MQEFPDSPVSKAVSQWLGRCLNDPEERRLFGLKPLKNPPPTRDELTSEIAYIELSIRQLQTLANHPD